MGTQRKAHFATAFACGPQQLDSLTEALGVGMSFSEPKWRERVQFAEDEKASKKRSNVGRRIERSLKKCNALEITRLASTEQQNDLRKKYQAEVAYRSTQNTLDKFRNTFGVEKSLDKKKRTSDKGFQIRMYTKVDRDYWEMEPLREWYNDKKSQDVKHVGGNLALDSAATAFVVDNPNDTDSSSRKNKTSHYMIECGGPHDPGGLMKKITNAYKGNTTTSMGLQQQSDREYLEQARLATEARSNLPHLNRADLKQDNTSGAPHWGHWQQNLEFSRKVTNSRTLRARPAAPWAEGD